MYHELKRTCTAIVLLIKPFVWRRSRCRRRGGLLKLPNDPITTTMTRAEIAAVLFIAFTEGLVKRLLGQKLMRNYNKKEIKRKAVEFLQLRK